MHVDVKYTIWDRLEIPEEYEEKVKSLLNKGQINNPQDLYAIIPDLEEETLYDSAEFMSPDEQGGYPTVEAYEGEKRIYTNKGDI